MSLILFRSAFGFLLYLMTIQCKTEEFIVACIGDSITAGIGSKDSYHTNYPSILNTVKGPLKFLNFGIPSATIMKKGVSSYWNSSPYEQALKSNPSIVIIQLGTNDAKIELWNQKLYINDYINLIEKFQNLSSYPMVYICTPPPLYKPNVYNINQTVINHVIPHILIPYISSITSVSIIDLYSHLGGDNLSHIEYFINMTEPSYLNDYIHPNDIGYQRISLTVIQSILTSDMYLPRNFLHHYTPLIRKKFPRDMLHDADIVSTSTSITKHKFKVDRRDHPIPHNNDHR
eukprot:gene6096-12316_t